jgi:hypothetical protein
MVRAAVLGDSPFEERFRLYEDQAMLVKVALEWPVYIGRHATALYRQHAGSTSARAEQSGAYRRIGPHDARRSFLDWLQSHAEGAGRLKHTTREALALANAKQSGDRSALTRRQRARLWRYAASNRAGRLVRRAGRLARRLIRR